MLQTASAHTYENMPLAVKEFTLKWQQGGYGGTRPPGETRVSTAGYIEMEDGWGMSIIERWSGSCLWEVGHFT